MRPVSKKALHRIVEGFATLSWDARSPFFPKPLPVRQSCTYTDELQSGLALDHFLLAEHYVRAERMIERYREQIARVFEAVDIIVTASCPLVAPKIGTVTVTTADREEAAGNALTRLTTLFNLTRHPALSTPCGLHLSRLPMGVQVVGRYFEETTLLRVAHALESESDWTLPWPDLDSGLHSA